MAVYQSVTTAEGTSSSVSPAKPSGLAVGDLMLAYLFARRSGAAPVLQTPSGWTALTVSTVNTGAGFEAVGSFWKIADSGDVAASTFTFTDSLSTTSIGAVLSRWSSPDTIPIVGNANSFVATNTTGITGGAVTPSASAKMVIFAGGDQTVGGRSAYATVNNNPAVWTETADSNFTATSVAMAYGAYPFTTTTGNGSYSSTTPATYQNIYLVAVGSNPPVITPSALVLTYSVPGVVLPIMVQALQVALTLAAPVLIQTAAKWKTTTKHVSTWVNRTKS